MLGFDIILRRDVVGSINAASTTFDLSSVVDLPAATFTCELRSSTGTETGVSVTSIVGDTLTVTRGGSPVNHGSGAQLYKRIHIEWPDEDWTAGVPSETTIRHNNSTTIGADDRLDFLDSETIEWNFTDTGSEIQIDASVVALLETGASDVLTIEAIAADQVLMRNASDEIVGFYPSEVLDYIDDTQGDVLYRSGGTGAAGWLALAPGDDGQVLTTRGASADPEWTYPTSRPVLNRCPGFSAISIATVRILTNDTTSAFFLGIADAPYTSVTLQTRITTQGSFSVVGTNWGEWGVGIGSPSALGSGVTIAVAASVNASSVSFGGNGDFNVTSGTVITRTFTVSVARGDYLWALIGANSGTGLRVQGGVGDALRSGFQQVRAGAGALAAGVYAPEVAAEEHVWFAWSA